jgi:hypothetical protein
MNTKLRLETDVVTAADDVLAKVGNAAVENRMAAEAATTIDGTVAESQTKAPQSSAVGTKMCIRCMQQKTVTLFAKPGRKELLKTCSQCLVRCKIPIRNWLASAYWFPEKKTLARGFWRVVVARRW